MTPTLDSEDTRLILHLAGCSLDSSPGKNWVEDSGGLPEFICEVARAIKRGGKTTSSAIAIAVSRVKAWAAGGDNVNADTRAKAAKALAQWEALKAKSSGKRVVKATRQDGSEYLLLASGSFNLDQVRFAFDQAERARRKSAREAQRESGLPETSVDEVPYRYVREVWSDFVIVENEGSRRGGNLTKVSYTVDGGNVQFGDEEEVRVEYVPVYSEPAFDDEEQPALSKIHRNSAEIIELHGHKGKPGYNLLHSPNYRVRTQANKIFEQARKSGMSTDEAQNAINRTESAVRADKAARAAGGKDVTQSAHQRGQAALENAPSTRTPSKLNVKSAPPVSKSVLPPAKRPKTYDPEQSPNTRSATFMNKPARAGFEKADVPFKPGDLVHQKAVMPGPTHIGRVVSVDGDKVKVQWDQGAQHSTMTRFGTVPENASDLIHSTPINRALNKRLHDARMAGIRRTPRTALEVAKTARPVGSAPGDGYRRVAIADAGLEKGGPGAYFAKINGVEYGHPGPASDFAESLNALRTQGIEVSSADTEDPKVASRLKQLDSKFWRKYFAELDSKDQPFATPNVIKKGSWVRYQAPGTSYVDHGKVVRSGKRSGKPYHVVDNGDTLSSVWPEGHPQGYNGGTIQQVDPKAPGYLKYVNPIEVSMELPSPGDFTAEAGQWHDADLKRYADYLRSQIEDADAIYGKGPESEAWKRSVAATLAAVQAEIKRRSS